MSTARAVEMSLFPEHAPNKPVGPILPSVFTGSNADLMLAVAPYYLTGSVCDVTYGEGKWWERYRPDRLVAHDLVKLDGVDFRDLPEADDTYDTVCFDPPYVTSGTASLDPGPRTFRERYGIDRESAYGGEDELRQLIAGGLAEACRVSSRWVLVKCMEFTSSRRFHDMPTDVVGFARACGWEVWDRIVHHTGSGPGGHNIFTPVRARRHHSYLIVFTPTGGAA